LACRLADVVILATVPLAVEHMKIVGIRVIGTIKEGRTYQLQELLAIRDHSPAINSGTGEGK
jgi:hypothetical protein